MTACQRCGQPVTAGERYCSNCGSDVSAEQGQASTRRLTPISGTAVMHNELMARLRRAALGEYEILVELGRGGMASVFLAHDIQLDRKVAIKVMLPSLVEGEGMAERFKLEARTAAALSHPHIIPIYAVRDTELLVYFVMKFVEGRPLDTMLREVGRAPLPMVRSIISKVGDALGYAHRRGVVHRDIKPANLMVDTEGQPVVTDFGIAKVAATAGLTMTGATIGTPAYMSPEQATSGAITGASDQYSLGVVAYQMLTGHLPFTGDTMVSLMYQHCHEPPPPFQHERPDCPPELHAAVMRMLAKRPEDRFPDLETAVESIGRVTLSFNDPVQTQLVDLAMKGGNRHILEGIRTPRSPIVTRSKRTGATSSAEQESATVRTPPPRTQGATTPAPITQTIQTPASKLPLVIGGVAVMAAVAFVLWNQSAGGADPAATAPPTAEAPSGTPPSTGAGGDGAPSPTAGSTTGTPSGTSGSQAGGTTGSTPAGGPGAAPGSGPGGANAAEVAATGAPTGASDAAAARAPRSIRVEGANGPLTRGATLQLRATVLDAGGRTLPSTGLRWSSTDPSRVSVSSGGTVTALATGPATIIASVGAVEQRVPITVTAARVASVSVSSPGGALAPGATVRLSASAVGEDGRPHDGAVEWRSSNPAVASVQDGLVTAVGAGTATIVASSGGVDGSTTVRVNAPAEAAPAAPAASAPSAREAIAATVEAYAKALETRQMSELRRVYTGMQPDQEQQLAGALRSMEQLDVTLAIQSLDVRGSAATANVSGTYEFFARESRRRERLPVNVVMTLEQGAAGWTIRQIRTVR